MLRRIIGGIERRTGRPVDPLTIAWIRGQYAADPATFRHHRRADDDTPWVPRVIVPNLALLAEMRAEEGRRRHGETVVSDSAAS